MVVTGARQTGDADGDTEGCIRMETRQSKTAVQKWIPRHHGPRTAFPNTSNDTAWTVNRENRSYDRKSE